ncbi:MAG TPA: DUF6789 family protein [Desulfobacteria bacterium]|nr:DUF6789 family protein [Desulfobacteria bacterium]
MRDSIDRTVVGAIGGIVGGLALIISLQIAEVFIHGPYPKVLHVAHLFIPPGQDHTFWGQVIAHIAHFGISALLGVLFINIFRVTGRDWATTKGLLFGIAAWIILYGVMGQILDIPQEAEITTAFVTIAVHLIFGVVTSWSVFWLSERTKL